MEDAATAEISRSQIWQWIRHKVTLDDGSMLSKERVEQIEGEELDKIRAAIGDQNFSSGRFEAATALFNRVALDKDYAEFLTIPAYEYLE